MGRPPLYSYKNGDKIGDMVCIGKIIKSKLTFCLMKCEKCGRIKQMLSATIVRKHGIYHKSCGKGLKLKNHLFYLKWSKYEGQNQ